MLMLPRELEDELLAVSTKPHLIKNENIRNTLIDDGLVRCIPPGLDATTRSGQLLALYIRALRKAESLVNERPLRHGTLP